MWIFYEKNNYCLSTYVHKWMLTFSLSFNKLHSVVRVKATFFSDKLIDANFLRRKKEKNKNEQYAFGWGLESTRRRATPGNLKLNFILHFIPMFLLGKEGKHVFCNREICFTVCTYFRSSSSGKLNLAEKITLEKMLCETGV